MLGHISNIENAARIALGTHEPSDPLPPGPNYGPFGYFRLGVIIFVLAVAAIGIYSIL